jgi:Protein of unknown function (DUF2939)
MKNTLTRITLALLALAVVAWVYLTPYLAARSLHSAVDARDAARIADHVNFPELRQSMKAGLLAKMTGATAAKGDEASVLLGSAFANVLISPMVDAMVSPEGLAKLLNGEKQAPVKTQSPPPQDADKTDDKDSGKDMQRSMGYETLNRFVVTFTKPTESQSISLVFTREGALTWKLSGLRLP